MITIQVLATGQIQVTTKLPEVVVMQILSQVVATGIARQAVAMAAKDGPKVAPVTGPDAIRILRN